MWNISIKKTFPFPFQIHNSIPSTNKQKINQNTIHTIFPKQKPTKSLFANKHHPNRTTSLHPTTIDRKNPRKEPTGLIIHRNWGQRSPRPLASHQREINVSINAIWPPELPFKISVVFDLHPRPPLLKGGLPDQPRESKAFMWIRLRGGGIFACYWKFAGDRCRFFDNVNFVIADFVYIILGGFGTIFGLYYNLFQFFCIG